MIASSSDLHKSLLSRERGLKFRHVGEQLRGFGSLLSRERGLKCERELVNRDVAGRSLHGSVD